MARYVHDLEERMKVVSDLLKERGPSGAAELAGSIMNDLRLLQRELSRAEQPSEASAFTSYSSQPQ